MRIYLPLTSVMRSLGALVVMVTSHVHAEAPPPLRLRQMIIRAPEQMVLDAMAQKVDDDTLVKTLLEWLEKGKAKVVSDLSTTAAPGARFEVKDGKVHRTVTENDQDSDHPVLTATAWDDVFIGTSLEGDYSAAANTPEDPNGFLTAVPATPRYPPGSRYPLSLGWNTEFRPKMPLKVRWPLVWPENKTPEIGWYEQDDFLVQRVVADARIHPGQNTILAITQPASDLEADPPTRELDVFVVQPTSSKAPAAAGATGIQVPTPRVMLFGFGVNDATSMDLLSARDPKADDALLAKLHTMVREGKAVRRLVGGAQASSGSRATIESVREHSYPTEMPTIPSAWQMRQVGTRAELELYGRSLALSVEHHPARFRWAEWICALDAPELITRQPQFFVQRVETVCEFPQNNVMLVTSMRTPECLKGSDKGPVIGETFLLFAQLDQPPGSKPIRSEPQDPPVVQASLEAIIFDLPATEAADWNGTETNEPVDDELRYQKALAKVQDGTASIACRLTMAGSSNQRSLVKSVEEVIYVTEYNPVDHNPTGRYRPTALESVPVGSMWEVDFAGIYPGPQGAAMQLNHALHHDALPASHPTLKEAMKYTQDHPHELPIPVFTVDEWKGSMNLLVGRARCLGALQPKGARYQNRVHVAFLRGVVRK